MSHYGTRSPLQAADRAFARGDISYELIPAVGKLPKSARRILRELSGGKSPAEVSKHYPSLERVEAYLGAAATTTLIIRRGYEVGIRKPQPVLQTSPPPWHLCTVYVPKVDAAREQLANPQREALSAHAVGLTIDEAALARNANHNSETKRRHEARRVLHATRAGHAALTAIVLGDIDSPHLEDVVLPTPQQRSILSHIVCGRLYAQIGEELGVLADTVKTQMNKALSSNKTRLRTSYNLAAQMFSFGLFVTARANK